MCRAGGSKQRHGVGWAAAARAVGVFRGPAPVVVSALCSGSARVDGYVVGSGLIRPRHAPRAAAHVTLSRTPPPRRARSAVHA